MYLYLWNAPKAIDFKLFCIKYAVHNLPLTKGQVFNGDVHFIIK